MRKVFHLGAALCAIATVGLHSLANAQDKSEKSTDDADEIVVTGTPQERYYSRDAQMGDRLGKDILDIPRSIESIPEQLLVDQHVRELSEVYRYSPNVAISDGYGGTREDYLIRGFRRRDDVYRDGVRLKTNNTVDPSTVSSVEILKGPASDIGQMTPGGLVNYITRKPQLDAQYRADVNIDSEGERQGFADATGGLGGGFAYRVAGSYENGETFRENSDLERVFGYAALGWYGDSGASALVSFEYGDDSRALDRGLITVPTPGGPFAREVADVSRKLAYHPSFSVRDADYTFLSADLALPLGEALIAEAKFANYDENSSDVHVEVGSVASNGTLTRYVQGNDDRNLRTQFARIQLRTVDEGLGPIKAALGAEYRRQTEFWINYRGPNQVLGTVTNPMSESMVNNGRNYTVRTKFDVGQKDYGFYALTDIALAEQLVVTLGGRYEFYSGSFDNTNLLNNTSNVMSFPTDEKFTKSAAVAWHPRPSTTIYANYSDTFQPASYYANNPTIFPAQNGKMYEVGVKQALFDDNLLLTGALYDVKQDNVVETVNGVAMLTGGQRSKGFEVGAVGSPARGFNIRGGIAYADAEVVSDNAIDGNLPANVPRWTASLWASYEFKDPDSSLQGLGFGMGVAHASDRFGDTENTYSIGGYTLIDSSIWYYIPLGDGSQIRVDAGVKNVGNEYYYASSGGTYRIGVGAPRTFFGGVSVEF